MSKGSKMKLLIARVWRPDGAAILVASVLGACVVSPAPYYGGGPYVAVAPPPAQVEVLGVPPVPGYIWLGGYWGWNGGRHEWVPGRWEAPRPGYRYVPHAWVHEGGGLPSDREPTHDGRRSSPSTRIYLAWRLLGLD